MVIDDHHCDEMQLFENIWFLDQISMIDCFFPSILFRYGNYSFHPQILNLAMSLHYGLFCQHTSLLESSLHLRTEGVILAFLPLLGPFFYSPWSLKPLKYCHEEVILFLSLIVTTSSTFLQSNKLLHLSHWNAANNSFSPTRLSFLGYFSQILC